MTISLEKLLTDLLEEIEPSEAHEVAIADESCFARDFADNVVLAEIRELLGRRAAISLGQLLRLGGYQLVEAGINIHKYGRGGAIKLSLHAGRSGIVYELEGDGDGFDVQQTVESFKGGKPYFKHKGFGFRSFDRAHVTVCFLNGGRATAIACRFDAWEALARETIAEPMKNIDVAALDGISMIEAYLGTARQRQEVLTYLRSIDDGSEPEDPTWGNDRWGEKLQQMLQRTCRP